MKISATLHTDINRGDHSADIEIALDCRQEMTIGELFRKAGYSPDNQKHIHNRMVETDFITLRLCLPEKGHSFKMMPKHDEFPIKRLDVVLMSDHDSKWVPVLFEGYRENLNHPFYSVDGRHFEIQVVSPVFKGKRTLEKQRIVYAALSELMAGSNAPVHAIARLDTLVPE